MAHQFSTGTHFREICKHNLIDFAQDILLGWLVWLDSKLGISSRDSHSPLTCRMECDICREERAL